MALFREYDIRGIVGKELTEAVTERIGRAFATLGHEKGVKAVSVGRDGRPSSPALRDSLIRGLTAGGLNVIDIGVCPTPVLYFSLFQLPVDGGVMITGLFCELDGRFPNHHPDPTVVDNLQDLIKTVKKTGADVGIGYDGDADRIGAVDEKGNILWGDRLMVVYSRDILASRPGSTIISEVKASQSLYDDIERHGGRPIMWKTGHSLIKAKMKAESAVLAGEMSGHMFFADRYFGFDDAIYASCRLVEILAKTGKPLSALIADLPVTSVTPEIRVDCPDTLKFDLVKRVQARFVERAKSRPARRDAGPAIREVVTIDGVRVVFDDGWGLIRASNTQPALVLRFEASSPERLAAIRTLIESELEAEERRVGKEGW